MKEKREFSRKQFLTGGASIVFGAIFGKLSEHVYAEEKAEKTSRENNVNTGTEDRDWDELPLDTLNGVYLVSDPESKLFGGTVEAEDYLLTQYFHVYPGLKLMLTDTGEDDGKGGWVGYNKDLKPNAVLRTSTTDAEIGKKAIVSVPEGVYYLRGSGNNQRVHPKAWVQNFAVYALRCGLTMPDVSSYMEITELSFDQRSRRDYSGEFDDDTQNCPSIGDMFFSPIGTDIIVTFNNANIAPIIHEGENYTSTRKMNIFSRHYCFGYSWYHCKTTEVCSFLGACYEAKTGCARKLPLSELKDANPHLYIKFPSKITNTQMAAKARTTGVSKNYQRLFTVVHITDTHGDADSTHAAYEYADQIGAGFVASTGDYVPYGPYHGYNILHSIIAGAKSPTVYTIGNHDVVGLSDQEVYSICFGSIADTIKASSTHAYYYRDFQYRGEVVRAISLCPFSDGADSHVYGYYDQEQLLWLCDALATAPDNAHIFILRHFSHHKPVLLDEEKSMFYDYMDSTTDVGNLWLSMGCDPVIEIVDAYNKRDSIFAQYSGILKNGTETVTIKYDFTSRSNSEFVAYFTGHEHFDAIGFARKTETRQVVLCSLCTTGFSGTEEYCSYTGLNLHRDYGTDSQIALNVFSFDFEKKKIYVTRVGNELYRDRDKTFMEISY